MKQYTSQTMIKFYYTMKYEEQQKFLIEIGATDETEVQK